MLRDIRRIFEITKILGILRHLRRRVDKMYNGNMDRLFIILYIYVLLVYLFIYYIGENYFWTNNNFSKAYTIGPLLQHPLSHFGVRFMRKQVCLLSYVRESLLEEAISILRLIS